MHHRTRNSKDQLMNRFRMPQTGNTQRLFKGIPEIIPAPQCIGVIALVCTLHSSAPEVGIPAVK